MRKEVTSFCLTSIILFSTGSQVYSEDAEQSYFNQAKQTASLQINPVTPFTGKIIKNKVRVRMQPSLDSPILR
ncbi:MAG: hypothetical protein H0X50_11840 [Nitrosopumilus sp.]|nr:hypothetical protein [Nitrosopumilus sp.]